MMTLLVIANITKQGLIFTSATDFRLAARNHFGTRYKHKHSVIFADISIVRLSPAHPSAIVIANITARWSGENTT